MAMLSQAFYNRDTLQVARDLLGKILVRQTEEGLLALEITETEAYIGRCDKACHAYGYKKTARTQTLFAPPGVAYIYLIYGIYHCLNFVTEPEGEPAAVLIRAGEPMAGYETMCRLRYGTAPAHLTAYQRNHFADGPGKLCRALDLTRAENGLDLTQGHTLWVVDSAADLGLELTPETREILTTKRIGIDYAQEAADFPWRFLYGGHHETV